MKCEIYSYYCGDEKEDLFDHINTALRLIEENSRLIRYALKVDKNILDKIRLAIIFHDLGKVFFQIGKMSCGKTECLSFRGHECISAYIFWEFRKCLLKSGLIEEDFLDVVAAILFHHHAMDIKKRLQDLKLNTRNVVYGLEKLRHSVKCITNFLQVKYRDCYKETVGQISNIRSEGSILEDVKLVVEEILKGIKRRIIEDKSFSKRFQIILMALITLDYMAAKERRGIPSTEFSEVVDEFYNLYLK